MTTEEARRAVEYGLKVGLVKAAVPLHPAIIKHAARSTASSEKKKKTGPKKK